jgi:exodeoxyribonuclease V gamma subunit
MAGLRLFTGNRLEILADKLAALLSVPLSSPLAAEVIIVQSRGMERWLSMEIARRLGVCANISFPFPKAFTQEAFASVLGDMPAEEAFTPEVMTWKIMKLLPSFLGSPGFEQIRRYLREKETEVPVSHAEIERGDHPAGMEDAFPGHGNILKRFQLAERIAYLFDQYLIFRPGMITAWEKGKLGGRDDLWQSELWRALVAEGGSRHPAALKEAFSRKINLPEIGDMFRKPGGIETCPRKWERISVFGISVLPRFYLEILHALSQLLEVNLFLMNPSREFWGDIRSDREKEGVLERVREAGKDYVFSGEGLYLERGNSLLASFGASGREFFSLIWDFASEEADLFSDPGEEDLLSCVQSDILNLRDCAGEDKKPASPLPGDRSIQFHSCHSPMREIEALYDSLLSMFEEEQELLPKDILVMAPDIEIYAPLIQAVFGMPEGAAANRRHRYIPFSIADRSSRAESAVIEGFMRMLDMTGGRFEAGQVLSLLEIAEIKAKFGLNRADAELIGRWVADTGIRWGIDGEGRRRLGLPAIEENTWREGLNRLLAGYAMPGREGKLINGILPYDLEGSETAILGRFLDYTEKLFSHVTSLAHPRTLTEWSCALEDMLDGLFAPQEEDEGGMRPVREAIRQLQALEEASGFKETLDVSVIKSFFSRCFAEKGFGYGFLTGGVTFCSMLPMRSIPFKVICLLGMNGAAYPRKSWAPGFDLIARHPQPGDRSRRKDDRYLFLEALLSARKRLLISYVGQSSEDNSILPPSVLVSELLDYLNEGYSLPGGGNIAEHLVTVHRLQSFSPAYFQGKDGFFSYSEDNWRAAKALAAREERPPIAVPLLSPPGDELRSVDISDLAAFFADPVRFFLRRRLDIAFEKTTDFPEEEEKEPFELGPLDKYILEQKLTEKGLAGEDLHDYFAVARASGCLPHGVLGAVHYKGFLEEVQGFVEKVVSLRKESVAMPLEVDLQFAGFRLLGKIFLHDGSILHYRCATLKAKDHLKLWIFHLALHALLKDAPLPARSVLIGRDEAWSYDFAGDDGETLGALLEKYWEGLSKPLKFFPLSSWKYGEVVFERGKPIEEGLRSAAVLWGGNDFKTGENENPYYRVCFDKTAPLDEEFCMTAEAILSRLIACRKEIKEVHPAPLYQRDPIHCPL